ncbi:MAG: DUF924 family protein [Pseudomonadales bacterium]
MRYGEIIAFWFEELDEKDWWKKSASLDKSIMTRFGALHEQAASCELYSWRSEALGRLAEIIVLDQFSRNIHRDSARAFAQDAQALCLAQGAIVASADCELTPVQRSFLYMPYMHSESRAIHEIALQLYKQNGIQSNLDFEIRHKEIIDRFGRYPHRNALLGRDSTREEQDFLQQPGSSF